MPGCRASREAPASPPAGAPSTAARGVGDRTLVVAHSFSGRTDIAGREIASMLGARYLRL
jgi:hypothetical protein